MNQPKYFQMTLNFADLRSARHYLRSEAFESLFMNHDFMRIEIKTTPRIATININS